MATVLASPRARRNLERLIQTHSLPASTLGRFVASSEPLAAFPSIGAPLGGRWAGYRFILGPWRWMLIVYEYHKDQDMVGIVTVQDARSSGAPTSSGLAATERPHPTDLVVHRSSHLTGTPHEIE